MKKQYLFVEFSALSAFYIIPPLLKSKSTVSVVIGNQFSFVVFLYFLTALLLYLQITRYVVLHRKTERKIFPHITILSGLSLVAFGELCVAAAVIEITVLLLNGTGRVGVSAVVPKTIFSFWGCLVSFLFSACYEEVMYRMYIPYALRLLFCEHAKFVKLFILTELIPVVIFAASHRYLGFPAMLNALFGGIILRVCFNKSKSIFPGIAAHFFYNTFMLFLQYFL